MGQSILWRNSILCILHTWQIFELVGRINVWFFTWPWPLPGPWALVSKTLDEVLPHLQKLVTRFNAWRSLKKPSRYATWNGPHGYTTRLLRTCYITVHPAYRHQPSNGFHFLTCSWKMVNTMGNTCSLLLSLLLVSQSLCPLFWGVIIY